MGVFLHCGLCGRKQADGLLSRAYWGHVERAEGPPLQACPTCRGASDDWRERLLASLNGNASPPSDVRASPGAGSGPAAG